MAKIIVNKGKPNERTVPLEFETTTIGRASDNMVVLPELYVSRQHLIIEKRAEGFYAHNLSSSTGTIINQEKVEEAILKSGDVITIGETTLHFELDPLDERTLVMEQPTVIIPQVAAPPPPACPKCKTPVRSGDIFCGSCGAALKAPGAPAIPPPAPGPAAPALPPRESFSDPQLKVPMAPSPPPPRPSAGPPPGPPTAPPAPPRAPVPPVTPAPVRPAAAMPPRPPAPGAARPLSAAANYLKFPKAGFGVRFIAYLIDSVILSVVGFILIGLPMLIFILPAAGVGMARRGGAAGALGVLGMLGMFVGMALYAVIAILYILWFWAKKGYTPGKKMLGLRVITQTGECPIGWGPAFMRFLGYMINGMIGNIGFLFILFDVEKRGLHDMIAKTYVVNIK